MLIIQFLMLQYLPKKKIYISDSKKNILCPNKVAGCSPHQGLDIVWPSVNSFFFIWPREIYLDGMA